MNGWVSETTSMASFCGINQTFINSVGFTADTFGSSENKDYYYQYWHFLDWYLIGATPSHGRTGEGIYALCTTNSDANEYHHLDGSTDYHAIYTNLEREWSFQVGDHWYQYKNSPGVFGDNIYTVVGSGSARISKS